MHEVNTSNILSEGIDIDLKYLMETLMEKKDFNMCCMSNMVFKDFRQKCILIELSHPIVLDLDKYEVLNGLKLTLKSFMSVEKLMKHIHILQRFT